MRRGARLAVTCRTGTASPVPAAPLGAVAAGSMAVPDVLARLDSSRTGLTAAEAARRLRTLGPDAVRSHGARAFAVLGRQLRSPLLILLAVTAGASFFVGERSDAVIIAVILLASAGLGFVNEYRAEKAAEALHSSIRHRCVVLRGGHPRSADVTELVPGDVIDLQLGEVVPADVRLLATAGLECEESVLTGESLLLAALGAVIVGALLPATPLARTLGFQPLPGLFFVALALMAACYLVLIEIGNAGFTAPRPRARPSGTATPAIACSATLPALPPPAAFLTGPLTILGTRFRASVASGNRSVKLKPAQLAEQPAPGAGTV